MRILTTGKIVFMSIGIPVKLYKSDGLIFIVRMPILEKGPFVETKL